MRKPAQTLARRTTYSTSFILNGRSFAVSTVSPGQRSSSWEGDPTSEVQRVPRLVDGTSYRTKRTHQRHLAVRAMRLLRGYIHCTQVRRGATAACCHGKANNYQRIPKYKAKDRRPWRRSACVVAKQRMKLVDETSYYSPRCFRSVIRSAVYPVAVTPGARLVAPTAVGEGGGRHPGRTPISSCRCRDSRRRSDPADRPHTETCGRPDQGMKRWGAQSGLRK